MSASNPAAVALVTIQHQLSQYLSLLHSQSQTPNRPHATSTQTNPFSLALALMTSSTSPAILLSLLLESNNVLSSVKTTILLPLKRQVITLHALSELPWSSARRFKTPMPISGWYNTLPPSQQVAGKGYGVGGEEQEKVKVNVKMLDLMDLADWTVSERRNASWLTVDCAAETGKEITLEKAARAMMVDMDVDEDGFVHI